MTPEELHACYVTNHRRLYLVALAITLDRQTAEDAVHDTLEKLLRHPRHPREPTDLLSYVTRAVRNTAIDLMRRRRFDRLAASHCRFMPGFPRGAGFGPPTPFTLTGT